MPPKGFILPSDGSPATAVGSECWWYFYNYTLFNWFNPKL